NRTDLLFSFFLVVSIVSASFAATDKWLALRGVGLTMSGVAVFWSCRYLATRGQRQALLDAVAIVVILVAATIILDAFGYGLDFPNARSRGIQGNRNWAAHLLALGMPLLALQSVACHSVKRRAPGVCGLMVSAAALVLTRSRASWIAAMVATALPLVLLGVTSFLP